MLVVFSLAPLAPAAVQPASTAGEVLALDRAGAPVASFYDGDRIQLAVTLPERANWPQTVIFRLAGSGRAVGGCTIGVWQRGCASQPIQTYGWHWELAGQRAAARVVQALAGGVQVARSRPLQVAARPVVMVHGFNATWEAWVHYLGPDGYLARMGLAGYALGDGQAPGVMNTGSLANLAARTNTIAQNAAILRDYIAGVKRLTGAQHVDLIAHSMGGLIARYYIDRLMGTRDVAQLITLGTPESGTDCSVLPAAIGVLLPATLEIRPSYITGIFNPQITHRHGVPFHAVAGTPIQQPVGSPCASVPSDLVISLASASAIPAQLGQIAIPHYDLNNSVEVFDQFVKPWLLASAGSLVDEPDAPASASITPAALQFSRVITGHVAAGASQAITIQIEPGLAVASFALYDVTRSLTVTVVGAGGQPLTLSPQTNGLVVVDDPATLLYLGYGFDNPRPGPWLITLSATAQTPAGGADFALTAQLQGGATASASTSLLLPAIGQNVDIRAQLHLAGQNVPLDQAQAAILKPDGGVQTISMAVAPAEAKATWQPAEAGLHGIDVTVRGRAPDGTTIERTTFLAVEAQPLSSRGQAPPANLYFVLAVICAGLIGLVSAAGLALVWLRRPRRAG